MLDRLNECIHSSDNQFGFKAKHGTDLCIYALKEMVNKYRGQNSSILMCCINASKAFDRVNHGKLFVKFSQRGVPKHIVTVLAYWYQARAQIDPSWCSSTCPSALDEKSAPSWSPFFSIHQHLRIKVTLSVINSRQMCVDIRQGIYLSACENITRHAPRQSSLCLFVLCVMYLFVSSVPVLHDQSCRKRTTRLS